MGRNGIAAQRLAGLGAAKPQHVAFGRMASEIMVETNDAVHLAAREIEGFGDQWNGLRMNVAEGFHQCVQNRQGSAFTRRLGRNDRAAAFLGPWLEFGQIPPSRQSNSGLLFR
jgi:hypothetical protein